MTSLVWLAQLPTAAPDASENDLFALVRRAGYLLVRGMLVFECSSTGVYPRYKACEHSVLVNNQLAICKQIDFKSGLTFLDLELLRD